MMYADYVESITEIVEYKKGAAFSGPFHFQYNNKNVSQITTKVANYDVS